MAKIKQKAKSPERSRRVLVGMSGGVDSAVAAALLLEQGYEVIGAFMKNWSNEGSKGEMREKGEIREECQWRKERRDALRVAAQLGIPLYTFDYESEYRQHVYEYMIREYKAGRTPNPDVLCNKYMKFGYLLREAKRMNCDFIATGHYARIRRDKDGTAHLLAGLDQNKDQSYFLCQLMQEQLRHVLFPIGELEKRAVRRKAKQLGLHVADKKDSQGICFVGQVEMMDFLKKRIPEQVGNIVTTSGEVIGQHRGHAYYTIGQRTGLGIGGGTPYFVVERKPESNELVVAVGENDPALFKKDLQAEQIVETIENRLSRFVRQPLQARIRYRQPLQECRIVSITGTGQNRVVKVEFNQPQKAVAPGQFIAFYNGDELIGSGVISTEK